jgi:hypothetical protein
VLNTMAPQYFDTSGIVDIAQAAVLWVRGSADAIVSDASFFDINNLGALGVIPGWPGEESPAQEMVSQTRDVLDAYRAAGGPVTEVVFEGVGHAPHLERPPSSAAPCWRTSATSAARPTRPAHRGDHPQLFGLSAPTGQRRASKKARSRARLVLQDAADHLGPHRQPPVAQHVVHRSGSARLVPRAEHDAADARLQDRARAHQARLEGDDERAPSRFQVGGCRGGATTSAWAVGSPVASRRFRPSPRTVPAASTTTAPTGISPAAEPRGRSSARRIAASSLGLGEGHTLSVRALFEAFARGTAQLPAP